MNPFITLWFKHCFTALHRLESSKMTRKKRHFFPSSFQVSIIYSHSYKQECLLQNLLFLIHSFFKAIWVKQGLNNKAAQYESHFRSIKINRSRFVVSAIASLLFIQTLVAQTITINSTSRSIFCANTRAPLDISFTETGFTGNRTFTAQLSNSLGSFTSPTTIGTTTLNTNNNIGGAGQIQATVNQPAGVYLIRIASTAGNVTTISTNTVCIAVYPSAPTITAPANTCASMFTLPAVTAVQGFNVQYSIDGGAFSASPSTTTPGCHTVVARYVLAADCGTADAGDVGPLACRQSNAVNVVIFPAAPPAPTVTEGCGPFIVMPPPTVVGFTTEYSFDNGATWGANLPPTAENCDGYEIRTRYVLTTDCGSTPTGAASTDPACAASPATTRIVDTEAPAVQTEEGDDETLAACNPTPTQINAAFDAPVFTDNCGTPTVEVTTVHNGTGCQQSDTRTWTATDDCGNTTAVSQTISYTVDTQDPTVQTAEGADANIGCNPTPAQIAGAFTAPMFADNCGTPTVTSEDVTVTNGCQHTTTRTWTATDACGNETSVEQAITYTVDTEEPVITCPAPITVQCAADVPAPDAASLTPSDNCNGTITKEFVGDEITNQTCANRYTITRTYRATDACGNSSTCTQVITVNDDTAPVVQNCPSNITVAPTTLSGTVVNYTSPTATDNCGGNPSRTQTAGRPSGATFPIGTTTNTYEFTDACGNKSTCTFTVTVINPYCDNNPKNRKVYVCHQGNTICVSVNSLEEHMRHGDYLGACATNASTQSETQKSVDPKENSTAVEPLQVTTSPNPSATNFRVNVESNRSEVISIRITDVSGKVIGVINNIKKNVPVTFGDNYKGGTYFAEVIQGANRKMVKLVKLN
jgi:hypothetical protein